MRDYDKSTMDTRNLLRGWRECDFAPAVVIRISSKRKVVFGRVPIEYDTSDVQGGPWGWSWHSTNQVHHTVIKILGKDIDMAVGLFMVIRICERSSSIFPKIQKQNRPFFVDDETYITLEFISYTSLRDNCRYIKNDINLFNFILEREDNWRHFLLPLFSLFVHQSF